MTPDPDLASSSRQPTEQRLHPASILFDSLRHIRNFAVPALFAMFSTRSRGGFGQWTYGGPDLDFWLPLLVIPSLIFSLARYWSFRLRYDEGELTIRSGLFFRNERRIPYARIQNLDAVQNVFHRLLGVVEIRVETGGGSEPEARISVLPVTVLHEMRERVFEGRVAPPVSVGDESTGTEPSGASPPDAPPAARTLLHLPLGELLLCGFLENKGMVLVGAAYGLLWEAGVMNSFWDRIFSVDVDVRGLMREVVAFVFGGAPLPAGRLALAAAGVVGFLVAVRIISMAWAFVRLYDFKLSRVGDDLRVEYGLFTRVTATVPIHRVQTLTIEEGWLHRRLDRASVRVETAGGQTGAATRDREWVAPIIRSDHLPQLLADVLPGVDVGVAEWRAVHPRAFRRAIKPALAVVALPVLALLAVLGLRGAVLAVPLVAWVVLATHRGVTHLGWAVADGVVRFRSGWITRRRTVARVSKIQAVATRQSPLDRRAGMARVRVDTAGASDRSHRISVPYLPFGVAEDLCRLLARQAAQTAFRW